MNMPCRITDQHFHNPSENPDVDMEEREERIDERVEEMMQDHEMLAEVFPADLMELSQLNLYAAYQSIADMLEIISSKEAEADEEARHLGLWLGELVKKYFTAAARAWVDENPIDHELQLADREREG